MGTNTWDDPRLRALMQESYRRGFCLVVSPKTGDGGFTAKLYCVADYRRDCEATGGSPLAAVENALAQAACHHGPPPDGDRTRRTDQARQSSA